MIIEPLLDKLGYRKSRKFHSPEATDSLPSGELSFALRHAQSAADKLSEAVCASRFHGMYVLQEKPGAPAVPVVCVFEAGSDEKARAIHRLVWNQDLVPFLVVTTPSTVRLYNGFAFHRKEDRPLRHVAAEVSKALDLLAAFRAGAIDDGSVWRQWGENVDPTQRANEMLLADLKELDRQLQARRVAREVAHGLIGKFVYLRYLRDRGILSDRKLAKWGVDAGTVFSRHATLRAFRMVNNRLQDELNGSVFKLGDDALGDLSQDHLRSVSGVFCGDSPSGQLHLDFSPYNFAHIPIETLSCVYEQFLHDTAKSDGPSRGKTLGAYYTPLPLADYVISELERKRPLKEGMKLLDPACGSGAFLVQCYRRLIEKKMRAERRRLTKDELRELLTNHIFGLDRDDDACRVAELSLILTLLDYVEPPDLENTTFKLPTLRDSNIFKDDFFDAESHWYSRCGSVKFDWVIGNPPWAEVKGKPSPDHEHHHAGRWITANKTSHPTGGNQIAEAFLWRAGENLSMSGVCGMLVPAMTWFKKESQAYRKEFFARREVWCLANFANLVYVLFARRAESPASAVFFRPNPPANGHHILTFAPFVAEQVANRPQKPNRQLVTWNIVVNGSELREIANESATAGESLTWKLAMWGSRRDERLLERGSRKFPAWEQYRVPFALQSHQGLELRPQSAASKEPLEYHPELAGKLRLVSDDLRGLGRIFVFPKASLAKIGKEDCYVRKGRSRLPLLVSSPPHVIVDAGRRFAVYSDEFIAVRPRQVGIAASSETEQLRALSIYLSSEFCLYHQFFATPQWGINKSIADLDALNDLPIPLGSLSTADIHEWAKLQRDLVAVSSKQFSDFGWQQRDEAHFEKLVEELNARVFKLVGLRQAERWLVEDFVRLHLQLNKGKVATESIRVPTDAESKLYLTTLRDCLDGFLTSDPSSRHLIEAVTGKDAAFLSVTLVKTAKPEPVSLFPADHPTASALLKIRDRLRQRHSQWVYFDRNLKVYERGVMYLLKPLQRLHWTRRQAVLDADEIIAETMAEGANA